MDVRKSFADGGPKLYICSTPIGNLSDVTFRLLEVLQSVEVLAAEDTRHTRKLLSRYEIRVPHLMSYHQHNFAAQSSKLAAFFAAGKSVALVSDAGTPGISDPGETAITLAIERGIPVVPVPGASAALTALMASGLAMQPFAFIGFLPREDRQRIATLKSFSTFAGTLIVYEAPHRLMKTLTTLAPTLGRRRLTVCKELTKTHETFYYGWTDEVEVLRSENLQGEFVLVIEGMQEVVVEVSPAQAADSFAQAVLDVRQRVQRGERLKLAVDAVATETGFRKRELYNAVVST